jgi:ribonuclease HI
VPGQFTCKTCGRSFRLPPSALAKYPGWTPRQCRDCREGRTPPPAGDRPPASVGPQSGIFTDGGCDPNPGPGGWAAVRVHDGAVVEERSGREEMSTNNRMELTALIEALRMTAPDEDVTIYCDSQYAVKTATTWASQWEANGWRRGKARDPVLNLDLVQQLLSLVRARPHARLMWLRSHAGATWNEYADRLVQRARAGTAP